MTDLVEHRPPRRPRSARLPMANLPSKRRPISREVSGKPTSRRSPQTPRARAARASRSGPRVRNACSAACAQKREAVG
jgi:hypothetical protein